MTAVVLVVLSVLTIAACLERARELHERRNMPDPNNAPAIGSGADAGPAARSLDALLGVPADGVPSTEPASLQAPRARRQR